MKTIKRENKVPKRIAAAYGGSRKFRIAMRRSVRQAQKVLEPLGNLVWCTNAEPRDICDVAVLLDRIARDLSQANWGK